MEAPCLYNRLHAVQALFNLRPWWATPLQGGRLSRLTIIPWFTKRPAPHHAFWPVSQGHTAAQGGGSIEIAGWVTGGAYAVRARYPRGATRNWGNYHEREMFWKTVSGTDKTVGCSAVEKHSLTHTCTTSRYSTLILMTRWKATLRFHNSQRDKYSLTWPPIASISSKFKNYTQV